ncbi:MAG TPA: hypothetical protein VML19_18230 [Verrucomicrobiae bacterium]|nr:hypothetical protein [Verrucomicrobiae bacterium]
MRYFLTGRMPEVKAILLVESGARGLVEKLIPVLRSTWGKDVPIDLVSCFATLPAGFAVETTRIYRVSDFRGRAGRGRLYALLKANGYSHMGVICSNEPLMTKWKWSLVFRIPAKVFIINENADFFWLARTHSRIIRRFVLLRTGLAGAGAVRTLSGLIALPFTLLYLMLYAAVEHTRRALR